MPKKYFCNFKYVVYEVQKWFWKIFLMMTFFFYSNIVLTISKIGLCYMIVQYKGALYKLSGFNWAFLTLSLEPNNGGRNLNYARMLPCPKSVELEF